MKIAIFGGAFNPVHNGHVIMARESVEILQLDRLLIIPSFISPHKSSDFLVSENHRLNMCRLAFENEKKIIVSDMEIKCGDISYTIFTLKKLRFKYTNDEFYLICGSDMFLTLQNWKDADELFTLATFCTFKRADESDFKVKDQEKILNKMGAKTRILEAKIPPYSSTEIRSLIKESEDFEEKIPKKVFEYIKKNHLYEE